MDNLFGIGGKMSHYRVAVRMTAVLTSVLLMAMPILCQQADVAAIARADAQRNVNGTTWLLIGAFLGILGYVIAMLVPPKAPASALIGKSPDYVTVYTEVYEETGKSIQMKKAMTGCLIGTGIQVALILVITLAAGSATNSYY